MHTFILDAPEMFENDMNDVIQRIEKIFSDREFMKSIENSDKDNWLGIKTADAFDKIQKYLKNLN